MVTNLSKTSSTDPPPDSCSTRSLQTDTPSSTARRSVRRMAQLCSAYLGKMKRDNVKKCQEPADPPRAYSQGSFEAVRGDRLYSSLRQNRPGRKVQKKPETATKTVTFSLPDETTPKAETMTRPAVSARRVSWASSERIIDMFCQPELRHSFRATGRRQQPSRTRYPRTNEELDASLSDATSLHPANIPVIVAQDYSPQAKEEVRVEQGTIVNCMYKSGEWVFVTTPEEQSGYIPAQCIEPIGANTRRVPCQQRLSFNDVKSTGTTSLQDVINHQKDCDVSLAGDVQALDDSGMLGSDYSRNELSFSSSSGDTTLQGIDSSFADSAFSEACSFLSTKNDSDSKMNESVGSLRKGVYFSPKKTLDDLYRDYCTSCTHKDTATLSLTVVFDYTALNYDDVSVSAQEVVTSLEDDDSDWVWVTKDNGQEGYIPRACTVNLGLLNLDPHTRTTYL